MEHSSQKFRLPRDYQFQHNLESLPSPSKATIQSWRAAIEGWIKTTISEQSTSYSSSSFCSQHSERKRSRTLTPPPSQHSRQSKRLRRTISAPTSPRPALVVPYSMAHITLTPTKSGSGPSFQLPSTPKTPSSVKHRAQTDHNYVSQRLDQHCIFNKRDYMETKYPDFYDSLTNIIGQPRESAMKIESVKKFNKMLETYRYRKEDTFLVACLPLLIKQPYGKPWKKVPDIATGWQTDPNATTESTQLHPPNIFEDSKTPAVRFDQFMDITNSDEVPSASTDYDMNVSGIGSQKIPMVDLPPTQKYYPEEFIEDGVVMAANELFAADWLPSPFPPDLVKMMAKFDGMTTAKPDRCFGLNKDLFHIPDKVYLDPSVEQMLAVIPEQYFSYCLLEGKSNHGLIQHAINQARRGGASLINAHRHLLKVLGQPDVEQGPDKRTFVFSVIVTPALIEFYAHWAEIVEPGVVHYQMDYLAGTNFNNKSELPRMRRVFSNILAWGCCERLAEIRRNEPRIHDYLRWLQTQPRGKKRSASSVEQSVKSGSGS